MPENHVMFWGSNQNSLLPTDSAMRMFNVPESTSIPFNIVQVSASEKHISFITSQGELFSYGSNLDGRLGVGPTNIKHSIFNPVRVALPESAKFLECGFSHVCVILKDNSVYSWGLGDYGALGTGEFKSHSTPHKVQILAKIRQVSCGAMHSGFIDNEDNVYMCGSNEYGELGINWPQKLSTPCLVNINYKIKQVACGVFYTLLLTNTGRVYGMGNNKYGQIGIGHKVNECHPTLLKDLTDIQSIAAGYHSGAIDTYGNLYIWGSGSFGELLKPKKYSPPTFLREIHIRGFFGVALSEDRMFVWGNNTYGELGNGRYEASKEPIQVEPLMGAVVRSIACGVNFTIAIIGHYPIPQAHLYPVNVEPRDLIGHLSPYEEVRGSLHMDPYHKNVEVRSRYNRSPHYEKTPPSYIERAAVERAAVERAAVERAAIERAAESNSHPQRVFYPIKDKYEQPANHKNYQQLFTNLSKDYEVLLQKFSHLQTQLQQKVRTKDASTHRLSNEIIHENQQQKQQNQTLKQQLITLKNQQNHTLQKLNIVQNKLVIAQENEAKAIHQSQSYSPKPKKHMSQDRASFTLSSDMCRDIESRYKNLLQQSNKEIVQTIEKHKEIQTNLYRKIDELTVDGEKLKQNITKYEQLMQLKDETIQMKEQQINTIAKQKENPHQIQTLELQIKQLTDNLDTEIKSNVQLTKTHEIHLKSIQKLQEERNDLLKYIQGSKNIEQSEVPLLRHKLQDLIMKQSINTDKMGQAQVELACQKQYARKCEQSLRQMSDLKDKVFRQYEVMKKELQTQKDKHDQLKKQIEKGNTYKKAIDMMNIQIEQEREQKEHQIERLKENVTQKQETIRKNEQVYENRQKQNQVVLKNKLDEIGKMKKEYRQVQNAYQIQKQQSVEIRKELGLSQERVQTLENRENKLERKLTAMLQQNEAEIKERQLIAEKLGQAKRQTTKVKIQKDQLLRNIQLMQNDKQILQSQLKAKQQTITALQSDNKIAQDKVNNLKNQVTFYREEFQTAKVTVEESNKINEELSRANKQFAENQEHLTTKCNEYQTKLYEVEDENKSYTPRYEALLQRNRQLDQRNKELSEMINKAIQIQAENYKTNILKEVEINTEEIIQQVKEEQQYKTKTKRQEKISKPSAHSIHSEEPEEKHSLEESKVKDEPYTKMVNQRLSAHKRKVNQSARKLANILQMQDKSDRFEGSRYEGRHHYSTGQPFDTNQNTQDLQRINHQMESLQQQKQQFMSKINSFAQKLKIL